MPTPRIRSWLVRRLPDWLLFDPFEAFMALLCLLSVPQLLFGRPANAVSALLPTPVRTLWALNLGIGSLLLLWGLTRHQWQVRSGGLLLLAVSATIYTMVIIVFAGPKATFAAAITLAFALACYARRTVLLTIDATIRRFRPVGDEPDVPQAAQDEAGDGQQGGDRD
jgi:hypothetical protein